MSEAFVRTRRLLGDAAMEKLARARVAVFGIGGVGGHVCEALVRSGVGAFDLVDSDRIAVSNLNRQIIATRHTLGQYKVDAMRERMLDISPQVQVRVYRCFFLPENAGDFPFHEYSYVVDAVDTVTAKLALAERAAEAGVPILSAMGAGNKLDPGRFRVSDISQTRVDPLARVMRRELRKRGIARLKVVWSDEMPVEPQGGEESPEGCEEHVRRATPGSTAFVPAAAGLMIASEVIRDLIREDSPA